MNKSEHMSKKIVLLGSTGQIGWELHRSLTTVGQVIPLNREAADLSKPEMVVQEIRKHKPHIIVNAAAYTAVDAAETESEKAMTINAKAPGMLAEEAKRLGALLVHYSTDYVFDGNNTSPYREEDPTNPLNSYGKSKLEGEKAIQAPAGKHLIFRTSWVYGMRGQNFLLTMLRLGKERDELKVVDDQIGAPTWCRHIAEATSQILAQKDLLDQKALTGIYHMTSSGSTSWHGFATAIF